MLQSYAMSGDQVVSTLAKEVLRLKQGIEDHRSNTGHGLCWLNDLELWKLLDSEAPYPHETIPMKEEFFTQCQRFYESRLTGTPYQEPQPKQTIVAKTEI